VLRYISLPCTKDCNRSWRKTRLVLRKTAVARSAVGQRIWQDWPAALCFMTAAPWSWLKLIEMYDSAVLSILWLIVQGDRGKYQRGGDNLCTLINTTSVLTVGHLLNADRTECRPPKIVACRRNAAWSAYG